MAPGRRSTLARAAGFPDPARHGPAGMRWTLVDSVGQEGDDPGRVRGELGLAERLRHRGSSGGAWAQPRPSRALRPGHRPGLRRAAGAGRARASAAGDRRLAAGLERPALGGGRRGAAWPRSPAARSAAAGSGSSMPRRLAVLGGHRVRDRAEGARQRGSFPAPSRASRAAGRSADHGILRAPCASLSCRTSTPISPRSTRCATTSRCRRAVGAGRHRRLRAAAQRGDPPPAGARRASVTGNHDGAAIGRSTRLVQPGRPGGHPVDADGARRELARLPRRAAGGAARRRATAVHGSPREPIWEYITDAAIAAANLGAFETRRCLTGTPTCRSSTGPRRSISGGPGHGRRALSALDARRADQPGQRRTAARRQPRARRTRSWTARRAPPNSIGSATTSSDAAADARGEPAAMARRAAGNRSLRGVGAP